MAQQHPNHNFFVSVPDKKGRQELNKLTTVDRLDLIRRSQGRVKYDMLIDARDGDRIAPLLHPQEIYLLVSHVGPEFASELILLTSTNQLTTLLDLDLWEGDQIDPKVALEWLTLILDTSAKKVCLTFQEMPVELSVLLLKTFIEVTAGPEVYDNDDADANANRLEGLYDIEYANEDAAKIVSGILNILQKEDPQNWMMLLELVRSELYSVLTEEAFQARNNRMCDYGFVPNFEARDIYARIDTEAFEPSTGKQFSLEAEGLQNPLPLLRMAAPGGVLAEVLASGLDHNLATELCLLANRKLAADKTDISREADVSASLTQMYDYLNLALEHLTGHDVGRAQKLFTDSYLRQLFQLGHSLVAEKVERAKELQKSSIGSLLDGPFRRFLDTLLETPAQLFCGIRVGDPQTPEAIRTIKQLKCIDSILEQVEAQQMILAELLALDAEAIAQIDLQGCNVSLTKELTLSDLFLTALANQLLGAGLTTQPIAAAELPTLHKLITEKKNLAPQLVDSVRTQIEEKLPGAGAFVDYCLELWQEEFCKLAADELDPRFLSGMLIRL